MSGVRKYVGLPDLDPAPDIYETPDLIDDNSTHLTSETIRSSSPSSSYHDTLEDDVNGIDRHRINQDEARIHFLSSNQRDAGLSSRISGKRKSHRSSERRRQKEGGDIINGVDVSSEEEDENLNRKLARLRREVAEIQGEFEKHNAGAKQGADRGAQKVASEIDGLQHVLHDLDPLTGNGGRTSASRLFTKISHTPESMKPVVTRPSPDSARLEEDDSNTLGSYAITSQEDRDISRIADFDARLNLLEAALGVNTIPLPTNGQQPSKALLPTLETLDKQLTALSTSTDASMDKIKGKVQELAQEAESLERKRSDARRAQEAGSPANIRPGAAITNGETKGVDLTEDADQMSKINALYGTLNTIESLAPLLPLVLDRLRSLRSLHTDAATASQSLADIETRQVDMRQELQDWREGLKKVENVMQQGEQVMKGNTEVVEGWVKELEDRITKLG